MVQQRDLTAEVQAQFEAALTPSARAADSLFNFFVVLSNLAEEFAPRCIVLITERDSRGWVQELHINRPVYPPINLYLKIGDLRLNAVGVHRVLTGGAASPSEYEAYYLLHKAWLQALGESPLQPLRIELA